MFWNVSISQGTNDNHLCDSMIMFLEVVDYFNSHNIMEPTIVAPFPYMKDEQLSIT